MKTISIPEIKLPAIDFKPLDCGGEQPIGEWCEGCPKFLKLCANQFGPHNKEESRRIFTVHCYFLGWDHWSMGFHICSTIPNVELHLPFGFIRIGLSGLFDLPTKIPTKEGKLPRLTISFKENGGFGFLYC